MGCWWRQQSRLEGNAQAGWEQSSVRALFRTHYPAGNVFDLFTPGGLGLLGDYIWRFINIIANYNWCGRCCLRLRLTSAAYLSMRLVCMLQSFRKGHTKAGLALAS